MQHLGSQKQATEPEGNLVWHPRFDPLLFWFPLTYLTYGHPVLWEGLRTFSGSLPGYLWRTL